MDIAKEKFNLFVETVKCTFFCFVFKQNGLPAALGLREGESQWWS